MMTMYYSLGLDYGTNSVRALIVRTSDGLETGSAVFNYPSGDQGVILDPRDHNVARQHPDDYLIGCETVIKAAIGNAQKNDTAFSADRIIGLAVDTTGSSVLPLTNENRALASLPEWRKNINAQCWLWKDHTSHREASRITELARQHRPHFVGKCGNTYSSEWWWSKIWHCLNVAPDVFAAAASWAEIADWIPSVLAGVNHPTQIMRGVCAAGHKALYSDDWGGLPDKEFLSMLDPKLAELRDRLYDRAFDASCKAGELCTEWADRLGLKAGIPIGIGALDVHYGAIGAGVEEGVLVKVIGTSTCDCGVARIDRELEDIPGICGIVPGSILPGYYGLEAGQSAVGDIFRWWVEDVCMGDGSLHADLTREAMELSPGETGLLALDWNNGNRTILVDQRLTGLLLGQTLHTTRAEIYRALIEATAFGARAIVERFREFGVETRRIICAGGIAEKNPLLMQIYADVLGFPLEVSGSSQACALGSAIVAAVAAGKDNGGFDDFSSAQSSMCPQAARIYEPIESNVEVYDRLYVLYRRLHDAFGGVTASIDLGRVMKDLLEIKDSVRGR